MIVMNKQNYNLDIVITKLFLEPGVNEYENVFVKIELGDVSVNVHSRQQRVEDFNEGRSFEFNCTTEDIIEKLKSTLLISVFYSEIKGGDEGIFFGSSSFEWPDEIYTKLHNHFSSHSTLNLLQLKNNGTVVGTLTLCTVLYCKCEERTGDRKSRIEDEINNLIDPNDMLSLFCGAVSQERTKFNDKNRCMCNECYKIANCYEDIKAIKKAKFCSPNSRGKHKKFKSCDQIFGEEAVISQDILESCDCSDSSSSKERHIAQYKIRSQTQIDGVLTVEKRDKLPSSYNAHMFTKNPRFSENSEARRTDNDIIKTWYSRASQNLPTDTQENINNTRTEPKRTSAWTKEQSLESPSEICRKVLGEKEDVYTPHLSKVLEQLRDKFDIKNESYDKMKKQNKRGKNKAECLSRSNIDTKNSRKIPKTTQLQPRPKNKIRTKQEFIRYMRKKYKNKYAYDSTTKYPGVVLGHKQCLRAIRRVPAHMGWLWNYSTNLGRKGWRPGAVRKPIKALMSHFLKEYPLDTLPVSSKASRTKCSALDNSPNKASENESKEQKPTVSIKKRNGEYIVTMRPLKDANLLEECSDPYLNVKPIQFKICKDPASRYKNIITSRLEGLGFKKCSCGESVSKCFCRSYMEKMRLQDEIAKICCELSTGPNDSLHFSNTSGGSESELDIEFTPPVALRKKDQAKKVDCACKETQYDENECKIKNEVVPKDEVKSKKIKTSVLKKSKPKAKPMPVATKITKVRTKS